MNITEMLHKMCHETLSNADVNAICKARGFSARESATRALFENFFLNETGVAAAMATLDRQEVILLYLLHHLDKAVDITVLNAIYSPKTSSTYGTFTQRYRDAFTTARANLVRRGLLLMAEAPSGGETQMARWRFRFPPQFGPFLPPLFEKTHTWRGTGEVSTQLVRNTVTSLAQKRGDASLCADARFKLELVDGQLRMGERPFRAAYLEEWQRACWSREMNEAVQAANEPISGRLYMDLTARKEWVPVDVALTYALSRLGPDEWVEAKQLEPILTIFSPKLKLPPATICDIGWRWGSLARHAEGETIYYRLPSTHGVETESVEPDHYLHPSDDGVTVDLERVPYDHLETLAQIARLRVNAGTLQATPDLIRLGQATAELKEHSPASWLRAHVPAFRKAMKTVESRWGKQIVHENLLIARVNDLSLKVALQRAFEGNSEILFLPDDAMAFPASWRTEVERAVQKAGHVVKTIS
jgi:hypothetical protein